MVVRCKWSVCESHRKCVSVAMCFEIWDYALFVRLPEPVAMTAMWNEPRKNAIALWSGNFSQWRK